MVGTSCSKVMEFEWRLNLLFLRNSKVSTSARSCFVRRLHSLRKSSLMSYFIRLSPNILVVFKRFPLAQFWIDHEEILEWEIKKWNFFFHIFCFNGLCLVNRWLIRLLNMTSRIDFLALPYLTYFILYNENGKI